MHCAASPRIGRRFRKSSRRFGQFIGRESVSRRECRTSERRRLASRMGRSAENSHDSMQTAGTVRAGLQGIDVTSSAGFHPRCPPPPKSSLSSTFLAQAWFCLARGRRGPHTCRQPGGRLLRFPCDLATFCCSFSVVCRG